MARRFHSIELRSALATRAKAQKVVFLPAMSLRFFTALLVLAAAAPASGFDDALYAALLVRHTQRVDDLARVRVDYRAIARSEDWRRLVASLDAVDPGALRTREEKLAFWVDAYNILAIDLVATHYPVASIRDIGSLLRPVWKRPAGRVGGRSVTLDEIEHEIVRPLGDPRSHAVVICASTSCPALPREPLAAAHLDEQLDAAVRQWLADPGKGLRIDRSANTIHLSKIFDWFSKDFEKAGGVLAFAARYAPDADGEWLRAHGASARIEYFDYDWAVNALPDPR
jgi:Protein of unknown function, DUF547